MATAKTLRRSFAGGEIAPELYSRLDLATHQTGLAETMNVMTLAHGPAANRPGMELTNEAGDSAHKVNILPFIYDAEQAYVLEFGHQYLRIHASGATLLSASQAITGISKATTGVLTYTGDDPTNGTWVYLAGITGMTELNGRYVVVTNVDTGANTFELYDTAGDPINTSGYTTYVSGGTISPVYEIATPYAEDHLFELHFTQSADVMTITHPSYQQRELKRLGAASWSLDLLTFAPDIGTPSVPTVINERGTGWNIYAYVVTAIAEQGLEESLPSDSKTGTVFAISGITKANPGVLTTTVAHGLAVYDLIYLDGVDSSMTQLTEGYYVVNTVPSATTLSLRDAYGDVVNTTSYSTYTTGGTLQKVVGKANDLATSPNANSITIPAVTDAVRYNVYRLFNGLFGYIGQSDGSPFKDNNITPDVSKTPPIANDPFAAAGDYPGATGYYRGRRWFAGTTNKRQNVWATRSGTEKNLSYSIPQRDDDGIAFRLTARQANTVRHIVPLQDLLLLTSGAEWLITTENSDALTPDSISYKPQGYVGASNVQPVVTNDAVLFAQARGGRVREMRYSWEQQGYPSSDISLMAPHLFDGYTITSMAYARTPDSILWVVRDDGALLGCTYMAEHKVVGWHHHATTGEVEAVCTIPEGNEDATYLVVKRELNGRDVRLIERLHTREFATLADAFFVDCGLTYSGTATATVGGLWHLEGETVVALADGIVVRDLVVASGRITLPAAASKIHIGLPYAAYCATLPPSMEVDHAFGLGRQKSVNAVSIDLYQTAGVKVGTSLSNGQSIRAAGSAYGAAPTVVDGMHSVNLPAGWSADGNIYVLQDDPLPMTVRALVMEVALGG